MAENRAAGTVSALIIQLFGPPEVRLGDDPLPRLRSRKGHWLLALLTLRHGGDVERAWLAGTLWPYSPESQAFYNLRRCLTDLRQALGPEADRLRSPTPHTLRLDLFGAAADVVAFDDAIARGDGPSLERAVSLYRGPLLEGCEEEWAFPERRVREEAFLTALERLAAGATAAGEPATAVGYLRRAVAVAPLAEGAQRALMQALAASGSDAAATEVYRDFRLRLHRELNAQPAPETAALHQQLRAEARRAAGVPAARRHTADHGRAEVGAPATPLTPPELTTGDRRLVSGTITFLFTDIEGSTRLREEQPEAMRAALARHDGLLHDIVEAQGGVVFKSMGDQICAAFATAADALAAALAAQRALQTEPWEGVGPLRVRMALHTGTAEERQGDYFGPTLSRVARLLEAGHGGQILLSQPTSDLCRDHLPEGAELRTLGEHRLKDLARPERLFQPVTPDLPADFPPLQTLDARPHYLPAQPTSLLGREQELAAAGERLRSEAVRLLTLTGPGGTGKTRLGLQVATELLNAFESGVYFVALAPISHPDLVVSAIAQTLGVRETPGRLLSASLQEYLRDRQLLLLLDNFEHLLAAAPLVAELLASCPRLKVLVTSRAPLHLRGEQEFPVPPLALPDSEHLPPPEQLSQYAAVALFLQQAQAVKPEFVVTHENAPAVAEICHRLDGLPLAIELAAARVKLFPPQALLTRMASRLKLLTGGAQDLPARQQTLRGAIAWSYDLLNEDEQRLFRRLSVFVGGLTLETAAAVTCRAVGGVGNGDEDQEIDLLDGVTSLVNHSLLRREEGESGEARFGMLETIREYGRECLQASGEADSLEEQHAHFFLALAETAEPGLKTGDQGIWLERLEREHSNLRAALAWGQTTPTGGEVELRLAGALSWFWNLHGYWSEGRAWLEGALARAGEAGGADVRAKALAGVGMLAWLQGDSAAARSRLQECVMMGRELEDKRYLAWSLTQLGMVAKDEGDHTVARPLMEESVAVYRETDDTWGLALSLLHLGHVTWQRSDVARSLYEESRTLFRQAGDRWGLAHSAWYLGRLARYRGDFAAARSLCEESLLLLRELGDRLDSAWSLTDLCDVIVLEGDYERAAALYRESLALFQELREKRGLCYALEGEAGMARGLAGLARVARGQGELERAARLLGAVRPLLDAVGVTIDDLPTQDPHHYRESYDRTVAAVRGQLDEPAFAAAWASGQAMSLEQAVAFALDESGPV